MQKENPLDAGQIFPELQLNYIDGSKEIIPCLESPKPLLLTIYRGYWCPVCRNHLVELQSIYSDLSQGGAKLIAASSEQIEEARNTASTLGLTFPVAYGLDPIHFSSKTGAFYNAEEMYIHATGFAIKPDGRIVAAVYSTGPRGRFTAEDWRKNLTKVLV